MADNGEKQTGFEKTLRDRVIPTVLAMLCVGAIWAGIDLSSSVNSMHHKIDSMMERIDRLDSRVQYLERRDLNDQHYEMNRNGYWDEARGE